MSILEFKRMSCVTDQYVTRANNVAVVQYASIKSALERTLNLQGWTVSQRSFIAGARPLNEKDLHDNLAYFKVPQAGIESITSKLAFKIFDEYANILACTVRDTMGDVQKIMAPMSRWTPPQADPYPSSSPLSKPGSLITLGAKRRRRTRGLYSINTHYYTHLKGGDQQVAPNPNPRDYLNELVIDVGGTMLRI